MRTISLWRDIELLEQHCALPDDLMALLKENLSENVRLMSEALGVEDADLAEHGAMIFVLERGDNWANLPPAGLHAQFGGLLGLVPEHVERVDLASGPFWHVLVILSEACTPTFWVPVGLSEDLDRHLEGRLKPDPKRRELPQKKPKKNAEEHEPDWI